MKKLFIIFIFILPQILLSQNKLPNIYKIYSPNLISIHPKYKIYNINDTTTRIYFRLNLNELKYKEQANSNIAQIRIKYIFLSSLNSFKIIDSTSKIFIIKKLGHQDFLTSFWEVKTHQKKGVLIVIMFDMLQNTSSLNFFNIDKTKLTYNDFLIKQADNLQLIFEPYMIKKNLSYIIETRKNIDTLLIYAYKIDTSVALPPYSPSVQKFNNKLLYKEKSSISDTFKIDTTALYFFSIDSTQNQGFSLLYFRDNYPFISRASQMIEPLIYITSSKAYHRIINMKNLKLALDNFWITNSNYDKYLAKELIRIYYYRVIWSNIFFTSYKEGWKTDRGMIYIVFGPPSTIYKDDEKEVWSYVLNSKLQKIDFEFYKKNTPFTENNFILKRDAKYLSVWQEVVKYWNNGNIIEY